MQAKQFIKFAPIKVPFSRRRQTFAVLIWMCLIPALIMLFLILASYIDLLPLTIAYAIFIYLDPAPEMGARKLDWLRTSSLWLYMRDYFPAKLEKTVDLDPNKNYVFGYHPHGIISVGAWINIATEANNIKYLLPGIDLRLMTLSTNFLVPFARELLLSLGICAVTRKSCENVLNSGPGNSIMIVVGGAHEAMFAFPGQNDLVIKKRLGFIKLALRNGASLVPTFGFGETDLWDQVPSNPGSKINEFQMFTKKYLTFVPPLLHGRGVFNYNFGLMPYRKQLVTVFGNPIDCPKIDNPTEEEALYYQKLYLDELQRVYDSNKDQYIPDRKKELEFVL
ncbi:Diacylglycerol O-acyltransferase 2 [Boothiomyces sp. JEL0866]|nr:Diacylglycerol O-acyltransferase 2 [Boothiomyces sp. JEL0866]